LNIFDCILNIYGSPPADQFIKDRATSVASACAGRAIHQIFNFQSSISVNLNVSKSGYPAETVDSSYPPRIAGCIPLCLTVFSIGAIENSELFKEDFKFSGFGEKFLCLVQTMFIYWKDLRYKALLRNRRRVKWLNAFCDFL
jgi:hypothetical protein